jgi:hypothetical protein
MRAGLSTVIDRELAKSQIESYLFQLGGWKSTLRRPQSESRRLAPTMPVNGLAPIEITDVK